MLFGFNVGLEVAVIERVINCVQHGSKCCVFTSLKGSSVVQVHEANVTSYKTSEDVAWSRSALPQGLAKGCVPWDVMLCG